MWKDSKTAAGEGRRGNAGKSTGTASWLSRLESGLKRVICYSCMFRGESRAQQHVNIRTKCKFILALEGETVGILKCCLLFSLRTLLTLSASHCVVFDARDGKYDSWIDIGRVKHNLKIFKKVFTIFKKNSNAFYRFKKTQTHFTVFFKTKNLINIFFFIPAPVLHNSSFLGHEIEKIK